MSTTQVAAAPAVAGTVVLASELLKDTPPAQVAAEIATEALAFTGLSTTPILLAGLAAIAIGLALGTVARQRAHEPSPPRPLP